MAYGSLEGTGKAPLVAPPDVMRMVAEAVVYQDDYVRTTRDPRAKSDPEYVEAAKACLADDEHDIVTKYFLATGLVTIHELDVDPETKDKLRPNK